MSQKVHALGFRLGTSQTWDTQLQCYNYIPTSYSLLVIKKHQANTFLRRILSKNSIILSDSQWSFKDFMIHCDSFYTPYQKLKNSNIWWIKKSKDLRKNSKVFKSMNLTALQSWFDSFLIPRFYRVHWLHSPKSLACWISLKLEQHKPIKFIIKQLKKDLSKNKNWIHSTKQFISGSTKFYLKGIKIICCGRLRGKRQRMSNTIAKQIGVMPLQKLNAFVEYENISAYTRFGKVGIHVYYYYSPKI
uniref:ribosomal protein S3 n=1 Tax=Pseudoerythrocladia kornmannii TaxID=753682 RepID=UPI001FCD4376|nr:ribosomal protein S3 [Pseudoerythrocladia kornmannii]UNJ19041.1 ribosomal protein S3 [Pseudoerythrocladia kornmannii]